MASSSATHATTSASQIVFACPIQLFKFQKGEQQLVGVAGAAIVFQKAPQSCCYLLQCYSQSKELHCSEVVKSTFDLHVTFGEGGACYASFWDSFKNNWSVCFRSISDCATFVAHFSIARYLSSSSSSSSSPISSQLELPYISLINPNNSNDTASAVKEIKSTHRATLKCFQWAISSGDLQITIPHIFGGMTEQTLTVDGPDMKSSICGFACSGPWNSQYRFGINASGTAAFLLELLDVVPLPAPAPAVVAVVAPAEAVVALQPPTTTTTTNTTTNATPTTPLLQQQQQQQQQQQFQNPQLQQFNNPYSSSSSSSSSDAVLQALMMQQMQQQPLHFASLHKRFDQVSEKFDKFDLNSQFSAFEKIICDFDAHNKQMYQQHGQKDKEYYEAQSSLNKERGEHGVTRQELAIAQRELRLQTELRISYSSKATKWKQKFRALEKRGIEERKEYVASTNEQIEQLQRMLNEERAKKLELQKDHTEALKMNDKEAFERGKLEAFVNQDIISSSSTTTSSDDGNTTTTDRIIQLKARTAKLTEDAQLAKKLHFEEVVTLQEKLLQEKEEGRELQRKLKEIQKLLDEATSQLQEKEQQLLDLQHDHETSMNKMKERLINVGEGQLMMQFEKLKVELSCKEKEQETIKEQYEEGAMKIRVEMESLVKQRDRMQDDLRELQSFQFKHDNELNASQMQLIKQKEQGIQLANQLSRLQTEHQVLISERNDLRLELESKSTSSSSSSSSSQESAVIHPPANNILEHVKEIMSSLYYELEDKFDAETTYTGDAILEQLLVTIKEQTLNSSNSTTTT